MAKTKKTSDALQIIHQRFYEGKPDRIAELAKARADDVVSRKLRALREKAGLSQRELAKLAHTSASAICRMEAAEYTGHSLAVLTKVAGALNRRVEINFVALRAA